MNRRQDRIRRLIQLRESEVVRAVNELHGVLRELERVQAVEQEARLQLLDAEGERRSLSGRMATAGLYRELEEWLDTLALRHATATRAVVTVRKEARRLQVMVQRARTQQKQAESLLRRVLAQEQREEQRVERRNEDELTQNKWWSTKGGS